MGIKMFKFLASYVDVATGLVGIATLGFYRPYWDIKFVTWHAKHLMEKRRMENVGS